MSWGLGRAVEASEFHSALFERLDNSDHCGSGRCQSSIVVQFVNGNSDRQWTVHCGGACTTWIKTQVELLQHIELPSTNWGRTILFFPSNSPWSIYTTASMTARSWCLCRLRTAMTLCGVLLFPQSSTPFFASSVDRCCSQRSDSTPT